MRDGFQGGGEAQHHAAGHVKIPISDSEASITYHLAMLRTSREEFSLFVKRLGEVQIA